MFCEIKLITVYYILLNLLGCLNVMCQAPAPDSLRHSADDIVLPEQCFELVCCNFRNCISFFKALYEIRKVLFPACPQEFDIAHRVKCHEINLANRKGKLFS